MPSFTLDAGRFPPGSCVRIGRDPEADVRLFDRRVSRAHAEIELDEQGLWRLTDLGGPGGTWVDASRIERLTITEPVEVLFGDAHNGASVTFEPAGASAPVSVVATGTSTIRIGRAPDNDVVVFDLLVSRYHAEIRIRDGVAELVDLGSNNGSYVDGHLLTRATLREGQRLTFGHSSFRFQTGTLQRWTDPAGAAAPAIDARGISVVLPDGQRILDDVSFTVAPKGFVAIVGPTGSGKSTLLRALSGIRPPEEGAVHFGGRDLYNEFDELRRTIGYVPQDDSLHTTLTVRRALMFASELRFPSDATAADRQARVKEVIAELGLGDRPDTVINKLSGGQRKRTSLAIELLTKPSLLFLDEPTSGLDPGYEKSVMAGLRELADSGRAVVVVTHSIQSLDLCDNVLFLAKGGIPAFFGPAKSALAHFRHDDLADVFPDLERLGKDMPRFGPRSGANARRPSHEGMQRRPAMPHADRARQFWTLVRRQVAVLASDRRTFAFLAAEVLIPALLILALSTAGAFDPTRTTPGAAQTLISAMAISAAAIGAANTLREIVKEVTIYQRERATVLSPSMYLASKFLVFGAVTAAQVAVLVVVATARAGGPSSAVTALPARFELIFDLSLAAAAAAALGLATSAFFSTSEIAMTLIAVVFILQWLFSGAAVDLQDKPVVQQLSYLASSNWGVAASASSVDLKGIDPATCTTPSNEPSRPCDARWTHNGSNWITSVFAMGVLTAGALVLARFALLRKDPIRPGRKQGVFR